MGHIHELIDYTVGAYIVQDHKVLLVHHKRLEKWLSVGGHVELDEDPIEAVHREVKEEAGLEIKILGQNYPGKYLGRAYNFDDRKSLIPPRFMDIHSINETHKHIGMYYVAVPVSGTVTLNEEEHYDIRWFSSEELDLTKTSDALRAYARIAIEEVETYNSLGYLPHRYTWANWE